MVKMLNIILKIICIWRIIYGSLSFSFALSSYDVLLEDTHNNIKNNNEISHQQQHQQQHNSIRKLSPITMEATTRIINGVEAPPLRYPYVALLAADGGILKCAGSVCLRESRFMVLLQPSLTSHVLFSLLSLSRHGPIS